MKKIIAPAVGCLPSPTGDTEYAVASSFATSQLSEKTTFEGIVFERED
jgi:hypothetical protein